MHSSVVDEPWFAWHSMPTRGRSVGERSDQKAWEHTKIHDMVAADGTVIDDDIPCPQSDRIPLEDAEVSERRYHLGLDEDALS